VIKTEVVIPKQWRQVGCENVSEAAEYLCSQTTNN
jgi:hypothetical protein